MEKPVVTINWHVEDIESALLQKGYKNTTENINKLIEDTSNLKALRDVSIQYGWEILDALIDDVEGLERE